MRKNLARLGGYPTHGDVADMSNLFIFVLCFMIKGMTRLQRSRLLKRNGMNKNQYKH